MTAIPIKDDHYDVLRQLNRHRVRYLVIGGYANIFHGHCRPTEDLDILIDHNDKHHERLCCALKNFEVPQWTTPSVDQLMQPYKKLWNGYYKFDILNAVQNLDFERAYSMRLTFKLHRLKIPVVSVEHLIHIKRVTADSEKDKTQGKHLADIAVLEALKTR
jgi:hypothetical protein